MFKKTFLTVLVGLSLVANLVAIADLNQFNTDFNTMMTGLARDVAPTLRLGALSGDLQGDANIDHFTFTVPAFGLNVSNGLGTNLQPGAAKWTFPLAMDNLVNDNSSSDFFEHVMAYPNFKVAFGMGFGTWDFTVSGMYLPPGLSTALDQSSSTLKKLGPTVDFGNFGLQFRKRILSDSGNMPGLSLGAGYHLTFFDISADFASLNDFGIGPQELAQNQTLDLNDGTFAIHTLSHVMTIDFQISKHLLIFNPYLRLSGAYQNSTYTGNAHMTANITDSSNSANDSTRAIASNPSVNVSDFALVANPGLELDIFVLIFNINAAFDVSRYNLNIGSWSDINSWNANGFTLNTGFRYAF